MSCGSPSNRWLTWFAPFAPQQNAPPPEVTPQVLDVPASNATNAGVFASTLIFVLASCRRRDAITVVVPAPRPRSHPPSTTEAMEGSSTRHVIWSVVMSASPARTWRCTESPRAMDCR